MNAKREEDPDILEAKVEAGAEAMIGIIMEKMINTTRVEAKIATSGRLRRALVQDQEVIPRVTPRVIQEVDRHHHLQKSQKGKVRGMTRGKKRGKKRGKIKINGIIFIKGFLK